MRKILLLVLMLAIVVGSQYMIAQRRAGVMVTHEQIAGNPVDRYLVAGSVRGTVIVVHGFAGSKELMQHWGYALAAQGFDTYVIDQPGHGEQARALPEWRRLAENPLGANLRAIVAELVRTGRAQPGKVALVGHSMGGAAVVAAGLEDPAVAATVAISAAYADPLPADRPANLLSLVAERDPAPIRAAAEALQQTESRKSVVVSGRNHLTILYDRQVMEQAAAWIHRALGTQPPGPVGEVAPWGWILAALAGGFGAVLAVAWLLIPPEVRLSGRQPSMTFLSGLIALAVAALSAVLAAVYLRTPRIGVAVLDYLLPYFLVAALVLLVLRWLWPRDFALPILLGAETLTGALLRGAGIGLAYLGAVAPVIHMNLSYHMVTAPRVVPFLATAVVLWGYAVQEEAIKRAVAVRQGPLGGFLLGLAGKAVFVGTWFGAAALPNPPTFLILTIPVTAALLAVLEVVGAVLAALRYAPATTATLNALVLAWTVAATFPLV